MVAKVKPVHMRVFFLIKNRVFMPIPSWLGIELKPTSIQPVT